MSQYFHARERGLEDLGMLQALQLEESRLEGAQEELRERGSIHYSHQKHSYFTRGLYAEQLDRYYALFPKENILLLRSEDYFADPGPVVAQVCSFLGVSAPPSMTSHHHANRGSYSTKEIDPKVIEYLRARFAEPNERLEATYGIHWDDPSEAS